MLYTNRVLTRRTWTALYSRPIICSGWFASRNPRMASTLPNLPVFQAISRHDPSSTAIIHSRSGRRFTYGELLADVAKAKDRLGVAAGKDRFDGERIAFIIENSYDYVGARKAVLLSTFMGTDMFPSDATFHTRRTLYRPTSLSSISAKGTTVYYRSKPSIDVASLQQVLQQGSRCFKARTHCPTQYN